MTNDKSAQSLVHKPQKNTSAAFSNTIQIYDSSNIDKLIWPDTTDAQYAKELLIPFIKNGVSHYINNIEAKIQILSFDSCIVPLAIIDNNYENSYVCSPFGHYVAYALEAKHLFKRKIVKNIACGFAKKLGSFLRYGKINKIIYVNNWFFPTDLYSKDFKAEHIFPVVKYLVKNFPDHAIAFRSINAVLNSQLFEALKTSGFDNIVSRQVFLTDTKNEKIYQTRIFKSDLKLLRESSYEISNSDRLSESDLAALLNLYNKLYVDKYSRLNPQLNINYFKLLFEKNLLQFKVLKKEGKIEGVFGYYCRNGVMTAPIFGYEESTPDQKSLYRLLSTLLTLEAKERGMLLHQSAGASFYKKLRRAESYMEVMSVCSKHLPLGRKLPWKALKLIMNYIAAPFMKKY